MGTKTKREYNSNLAIWNEMSAFDRKDYNYYDKLTDDEKKQFSPYILMKWGANVEGNNNISKYYIAATNEYINNNFWDIQKHKKLQWLNLCVISPGIGKQRHYWITSSKKETNKLKNKLLELFPERKKDEIDLILKVNSDETILEWLKQTGMDKKELNLIMSKK